MPNIIGTRVIYDRVIRLISTFVKRDVLSEQSSGLFRPAVGEFVIAHQPANSCKRPVKPRNAPTRGKIDRVTCSQAHLTASPLTSLCSTIDPALDDSSSPKSKVLVGDMASHVKGIIPTVVTIAMMYFRLALFVLRIAAQ